MQLHWLRRGAMIACLIAPAGARADASVGDSDKSEVLATGLALTGTLAGAGVVVAALTNGNYSAPLHDEVVPLLVAGSTLLVFGPSFGNWYAHQGLSTGLAMRLGGGLVGGIGGSLLASSLFRGGSSGWVGLGLGLAGAGLFVTGTGLDIWQAHRSVELYNRDHATRRLAILPTLIRSGGVQQAGLAVVAAF